MLVLVTSLDGELEVVGMELTIATEKLYGGGSSYTYKLAVLAEV